MGSLIIYVACIKSRKSPGQYLSLIVMLIRPEKWTAAGSSDNGAVSSLRHRFLSGLLKRGSDTR